LNRFLEYQQFLMLQLQGGMLCKGNYWDNTVMDFSKPVVGRLW
jgi:hypothetical protein